MLEALLDRLALSYMSTFSNVGKTDPTWAGYAAANSSRTDDERVRALISISETRYKETFSAPLDGYFRRSLRPLLKDRDLLEIGCNHGGATLAYLEQYSPKTVTGVEVTDEQVRTARLFFSQRGVDPSRFKFDNAFAERLPFSGESFDAIVAFDVWEHVQDVNRATEEAYRVLRSDGIALLVFPSYFHPTQHHLFEATHAPFVHWFFNPERIMRTYWRMLEKDPPYQKRIGVHRRPLEEWEKLRTINGTTKKKFERMARLMGWQSIEFVPLPFGIAGTAVQRRSLIKALRWLSAPLTRIPLLEEVSNQRVVCILRK